MKKIATSRSVAFLTFMVFFMNALLPFFAVYPSPAQAQESSGFVSGTDSANDKILICTSQGYKWVSLKDFQGGKHQPTEKKHVECGLCFISAHGLNHLLSSSGDIFSLTPAQAKGVYHTDYTDVTIRKLVALGHFTRAPPFLV